MEIPKPLNPRQRKRKRHHRENAWRYKLGIFQILGLLSPFVYHYFKYPENFRCVKIFHSEAELQQANCGNDEKLSNAARTPVGAVVEDFPHLRLAVQKMREALWSAEEKGFLKPDNFEILDFNMGDGEHGWNPQYFSKEKIVRHPYSIVGPYSTELEKKEIESLSAAPAENSFITLRRYKYSKRGDMDYLYLVIPKVNDKKCGKNVIENLETELSKDIVTDSKILYGCYRMKDGSINLFHPIIYRLRISEGDKWAMEPRFLATFGYSVE